VWRYPILYPEEKRWDYNGDGEKTQAFLQYAVPQVVNNTSIPSPGRNVSLYQPLFDSNNLFTWPRDLSQIKGYSSGKEIYSFGKGILIGNDGMTDTALERESSTTSEDVEKVKSTVSWMFESKFTFRRPSGGLTIWGGLNEDKVLANTQIGTTDFSNISGILFRWPAGVQYESPGGYDMHEQRFRIDTSVYTQEDGVLCVGFAVPQLANKDGSRLWGGTSPYWTSPDPGLLLPRRFTWNNKKRVPNQAPNAKEIRGVTFSDSVYNSLPTNTEQTVKFRVFNYSFMPAQPFQYEVYYQDLENIRYAASIADATLIHSGTVPAISGRSDYTEMPDNWHDVSFDWTTPSKAGTGYMFIDLRPAETQLSKNNDRGYIKVGIFDIEDIEGTVSVTSSARRASARRRLEDEGFKLFVESITVKDENGNELSGALPTNKPFEIAIDVRLDGPSGRGLPMVKVNLYEDGSPAGTQHIPYLPCGQSDTITFEYDASGRAGMKTLNNLDVKVYSDMIGFSESNKGGKSGESGKNGEGGWDVEDGWDGEDGWNKEDPLSDSVELIFEGGTGSGDGSGVGDGNGDESGSGSVGESDLGGGGCDAGLGLVGFALIALTLGAALKRGR
jgi:hypothetical protein